MKKLMIAMATFVVVGLLAGCGATYEKSIKFNTKNVDVNVEDEYLAYFMKTSCVHCQKFRPTINEYTKEKGALNVYAFDLDNQDAMKAAGKLVTENKWPVEATPTLIYVKDGKMVAKYEGDTVKVRDLPVRGDYAKLKPESDKGTEDNGTEIDMGGEKK